jgi:hypothetical protein
MIKKSVGKEKEIVRGVFIGLIIALLVLTFASWGQSQSADRGGIVIKVKPRIIVLPEGRIAKVSISSARFRSDGLKELNKKHGAVSVEKLFKVEDKKSELPSTGGGFVSKERAPGANEINLGGILTKEGRADMEKEEKTVARVADTYLLEFAEPGDMRSIVKEYGAVKEVLDVMAVKGKNKE